MRSFPEVPDGFEPPIRELQSHALPLGYGTICHRGLIIEESAENVKRKNLYASSSHSAAAPCREA